MATVNANVEKRKAENRECKRRKSRIVNIIIRNSRDWFDVVGGWGWGWVWGWAWFGLHWVDYQAQWSPITPRHTQWPQAFFSIYNIFLIAHSFLHFCIFQLVIVIIFLIFF